MAKAGLLESPKRGLLRITERGRQVLRQNPTALNVQFLEQFEEFVTFRRLRRERAPAAATSERDASSSDGTTEGTPEESLEGAYFAVLVLCGPIIMGAKLVATVGTRTDLDGRKVYGQLLSVYVE
jgi:hypothetical protein